MWLNYLACAFIIFSFVIAAYFYDHKGKKYANGKVKKIKSAASFAYIYHYLRFSTVFFSLSALLTNWPWLLKIHTNPLVIYAGLFCIMLGNGLFIAAKKTLGNAYSPCFDAYMPKQLVFSGIYNYIRHPIYTANLLLMFGILITSGSLWLLFNFLILGYFYTRSILNEEKALQEEYPTYSLYKSRTGMFLPQLFKHGRSNSKDFKQ